MARRVPPSTVPLHTTIRRVAPEAAALPRIRSTAGYPLGMGRVEAQDLQRAYDEAVAGDVGPLVDLMHADLDWRGLERGRLWWRKAPA